LNQHSIAIQLWVTHLIKDLAISKDDVAEVKSICLMVEKDRTIGHVLQNAMVVISTVIAIVHAKNLPPIIAKQKSKVLLYINI